MAVPIKPPPASKPHKLPKKKQWNFTPPTKDYVPPKEPVLVDDPFGDDKVWVYEHGPDENGNYTRTRIETDPETGYKTIYDESKGDNGSYIKNYEKQVGDNDYEVKSEIADVQHGNIKNITDALTANRFR